MQKRIRAEQPYDDQPNEKKRSKVCLPIYHRWESNREAIKSLLQDRMGAAAVAFGGEITIPTKTYMNPDLRSIYHPSYKIDILGESWDIVCSYIYPIESDKLDAEFNTWNFDYITHFYVPKFLLPHYLFGSCNKIYQLSPLHQVAQQLVHHVIFYSYLKVKCQVWDYIKSNLGANEPPSELEVTQIDHMFEAIMEMCKWFHKAEIIKWSFQLRADLKEFPDIVEGLPIDGSVSCDDIYLMASKVCLISNDTSLRPATPNDAFIIETIKKSFIPDSIPKQIATHLSHWAQPYFDNFIYHTK